MSKLTEIAESEAIEAELDDTAQAGSNEIILEENTPKNGKGRPNIHPFAGRTYLLKDERQKALEDPASFIEQMTETYALTDERKTALSEAGLLKSDKELSFTVNGPIDMVLNQVNSIVELYSGRDDVAEVVPNISKERMVAPSSKLYIKPTMENAGTTKSGKAIQKRVFEEYSPSRIYGYVTVIFK